MKKEKIKINRIECNSEDSIMTLSGEIINGVFSFQTKIDLPIYWFNIFLNYLQKNNSNITIHDYIEEINFPDGVVYYELDAKKLISRIIDRKMFNGLSKISQKIGA